MAQMELKGIQTVIAPTNVCSKVITSKNVLHPITATQYSHIYIYIYPCSLFPSEKEVLSPSRR